MQKATNFHIRIPHWMVVELLAPAKKRGDKPLIYQLEDINGAEIMCKEYGHDNDVDEHDAECWNGIYPDDYETMHDDLHENAITGYKHFELCVRDRENAMFPYWFVEMLNRYEHDITCICDVDVNALSKEFLEVLASSSPTYRDTESLKEHLYSELTFKEGEDEYDVMFSEASESVKYLASELHEMLSAKGCAYVRFVKI